MTTWITAYIATALAFLGLDAVWLGTMTSRLYKPQLQGLLAGHFRPGPALLFYALYIAGVVGFTVLPAGRPSEALLRGGAFGLVAYATYDLTNLATLRGWPLAVTAADLVWGTLATGTAAALGCLVCRWLLR
ncbi:DUF2177 family protein [Acidocella sp. KAb 2-4]|uniref:DUF2177 family protein n=1 Tax=Acidocella sp. KAb 2-4 TaxID=2885158 RepID=UPI001D069E21|nr:DUF2177 family protein [Acidocella sp. KAb 2-4]MCB5943922.1 DUF2177 family protein [Acidocella sp. KAb 2-4]